MVYIISRKLKKIAKRKNVLMQKNGFLWINIYRKERSLLKASRGEIKIAEILDKAEFKYKEEYIFDGLNSSNGRPLRFDFAVFDDDGNVDFLIEY